MWEPKKSYMHKIVISNSRLTVLVAAMAAAGAVISGANASPLVAITVVVLLLGAFIHISITANRQLTWKNFLLSAILASVPLVYFLYAQNSVHKPDASDLIHFAGRQVEFIAEAETKQLAEFPKQISLSAEQLEYPKRQQLSGKTVLFLRDSKIILQPILDAAQGREQLKLKIRAYVTQPNQHPKPWEFDQHKYLAQSGIYSTCCLAKAFPDRPVLQLAQSSSMVPQLAQDMFVQTLTRAQMLTPAQGLTPARALTPAQWLAFAQTLPALITHWYDTQMILARQQIVETHRQYLPAKLADLLSSMVLGNRAIALPQEITYKFRDVGLSHILAASGFNLTIVIAMSFAICRCVIPSAVVSNVICFLAMLAFVSLAGPSPSVMRAALMCSAMLLARSGQRRMLVSAALALSFLITVTIDPLCTSDLGLQLSYSATVGIVLGTTALSEHFFSGASKWKRALADALAVVLVAQCSVMPIQLFFFWKTGTLFIPANLLVTPLVTPLTMIGFGSSAGAAHWLSSRCACGFGFTHCFC